MGGPPAELATASGLATFTPCGDRRWRVAIDGEHLGELVEASPEIPGEPDAWTAANTDGRTSPRRGDWMSALDDLSRPVVGGDA